MSDLESDIRITPEWFLEYVRAFTGGQIALDVCTEPSNPTGAADFFALPTNGLVHPWVYVADQAAARTRVPIALALCWGNIPYSIGQVIQWAEKAAAEARLGAEILLLTKDDCRPKWNAYLRANTDARCRIAKAIGFLEPDGNGGYTQLTGPRWGSCLWYFGRHRRRFERVFGPLGEVIHGLGPLEVSP